MDTALSGSVTAPRGTSPAKPGEFGHAATHGTATQAPPPTAPPPTAPPPRHRHPRHRRPRHRPTALPPTDRHPRDRHLRRRRADLDRGGGPGRPPGHAPAPGPLLAADQARSRHPRRRRGAHGGGRRGGHRGGVDVQRHHRRAHRLGLGRVLEAGGLWVVAAVVGAAAMFAGSCWPAGRPSGFLLRLRDHSFRATCSG